MDARLRDFARAFYKSKAWKSARDAYMMRPVRMPDGRICPPGACERCFERGRLVKADLVHHKVWLTPRNISDRAVALSPDNLMRVCRDCHAEIHYPEDYTPRMAFDEHGRAIPL